MPDAISLLKADHKKVRGMLDELEKTTERAVKKREKLLADIESELRVHTDIEETIFYPAFLGFLGVPRSSSGSSGSSGSSEFLGFLGFLGREGMGYRDLNAVFSGKEILQPTE